MNANGQQRISWHLASISVSITRLRRVKHNADCPIRMISAVLAIPVDPAEADHSEKHPLAFSAPSLSVYLSVCLSLSASLSIFLSLPLCPSLMNELSHQLSKRTALASQKNQIESSHKCWSISIVLRNRLNAEASDQSMPIDLSN